MNFHKEINTQTFIIYFYTEGFWKWKMIVMNSDIGAILDKASPKSLFYDFTRCMQFMYLLIERALHQGCSQMPEAINKKSEARAALVRW